MLTDADLELLTTLTHLPTIAGVEDAAIDHVRSWVAERPDLVCRSDAAGNLLIACDGVEPTLLVTAHLDHPGFIVSGAGARQDVEFRGGVRAPYFEDADLVFFTPEPVAARLVSFDHTAGTGVVEPVTPLPVGSLGRWSFEDGSLGLSGDLLHAPACDDLAGVAAALSVIDRTRLDVGSRHLGVLLTRAEEVGFVGAIAACDLGTIPPGAEVVCIETSRSFEWSPIGAGPVVRVGDRVSVFTPALTGRMSSVAAALDAPTQRKLMDGGACEATAFAAWGYSSTCVCLPLGNYHNQGDLDAVESGGGRARPAPEFISTRDHAGLIELLVAFASGGAGFDDDLQERLRARFESHRHLLDPR
jgi:endoglucanase